MIGTLLSKVFGAKELVFGIMDRIKLSPEARAEITQKMAENAFEVQKFESETDIKLAEEAGKNIRAEIESKSWLGRNWRPFFCFNLGIALIANLVIPMVSGGTVPKISIPPEYFYLFGMAFLGYGGMRTFEKVMGAKLERGLK